MAPVQRCLSLTTVPSLPATGRVVMPHGSQSAPNILRAALLSVVTISPVEPGRDYLVQVTQWSRLALTAMTLESGQFVSDQGTRFV